MLEITFEEIKNSGIHISKVEKILDGLNFKKQENKYVHDIEKSLKSQFDNIILESKDVMFLGFIGTWEVIACGILFRHIFQYKDCGITSAVYINLKYIKNKYPNINFEKLSNDFLMNQMNKLIYAKCKLEQFYKD